MNVIVFFLLLTGIVWLWSSGLRVREAALKASRSACESMDVQFLDQTVSLIGLGLGRDRRGRLTLRRWYGFEFSINGVERHRGAVMLLGADVDHVHMEHPDGAVIFDARVLHAQRIH